MRVDRKMNFVGEIYHDQIMLIGQNLASMDLRLVVRGLSTNGHMRTWKI